MPTIALQPGSTNTAAVKQLQDYLVSQGFMTQAQVNSGYGTYGPQTTAAVLAFQKAKGVDYSSGPGDWGPKTIQAAQTVSTSPTTQTSSTAQTPGSSSSGTDGFPPTMNGQPYAGTFGGNAVYGSGGSYSVYTGSGNNLHLSRSFSGDPSGMEYLLGKWTPAGGSTTTSTSSPTSKTSSTSSAPASAGYNPAWASRGITQDIWNSLNANQQATIGATLDAAQAIVSGQGSTVTLDDALKAAANDPNIVAKYSDALKIDKEQFAQTLAQIQTATAVSSKTNQMQFEADRRALAEQSAAAGQAYSGFRGLAEKNLSDSEAGIVTSSRADLQKKLNDATAAFEAKYGSAATNPITASFVDPSKNSDVNISGQTQAPAPASENVTGALATGVTGTQPIQQQQDVNSLATSYVNLGQIPKVIQP